MDIRVRWSCWAPASSDVKSSVPTKPARSELDQFTAADPAPGRAHPRRVRGTVAVPGQEQEARVDVAARESAGVALQLLAPAERLDLLADRVARAPELIDRGGGQVPLVVQLAEPLQRR